MPAPRQPVATVPEAAAPLQSEPPQSQGAEHSAKHGNLSAPEPSSEASSHGKGNAWGHERHAGAPTPAVQEHGQSTGAEPVPPAVADPSELGDEQTAPGQSNGHGNGKGGD